MRGDEPRWTAGTPRPGRAARPLRVSPGRCDDRLVPGMHARSTPVAGPATPGVDARPTLSLPGYDCGEPTRPTTDTPAEGRGACGSVPGRRCGLFSVNYFTVDRSPPRHAACSGPEGRRRRWSASSCTVTPALEGRHHLHQVPRARVVLPTRCTRARRGVAGDGRPDRPGPARHPRILRSAASRERRGRPGRPVQAGSQGP